MPLVEWALTPMGHYNPKEEYANVIASTNHLEMLCFVTGSPLARLPKPTKSCSDLRTVGKSQGGTVRGCGGLILLAPHKNVITALSLPTDRPTIGAWKAAMAAG